tara:strand:+ start:1879 stop:10857 length:8979 start_codon:yes stop_codon:yes gene_type:complete
MANGNNTYSSQASSGLDSFSDGLVGNQFTDGTTQFSLGNFGISMSVTDKDSREFSLGNFSEPITLDTLNFSSAEEAKILVNNSLTTFINFDRSNITNFTLYGSLAERLRVATQNIIKKFPAAIVVNQRRRDYLTGVTATNIIFDDTENETTLDVNISQMSNPFAIEYTRMGNLFFTGTTDGVDEIRNMTKNYSKYSLFLGSREFEIEVMTPATSNTSGNLNITVKGNPFSGASFATRQIILKPNTLQTEEIFKKLDDVEQYLLNRTSTPIYTSSFKVLRETNSGKLVSSTKNLTWPLQDTWNILIDGAPFTNYLGRLNDIAVTFDDYKTNLVSRFLTTGALKEFDTENQGFEKILQVYGRSFDQVKKYIEGLAYMTNVSYDGINNVPDTLLKNLARMLGWGTPSSIQQVNFLDAIFNRGGAEEFKGESTNSTPAELDVELYRKILVNTAYLFKSKGTRKSIEFLLRLVGAPEALIEFNEHVYVAGNRINMNKFDSTIESFSGGTYVESIPVERQYYSAVTDSLTFPPTVITGFTFGTQKVTLPVTATREQYPVGKDGYPKPPKFNKDGYFQSGAGWFERTPEHKSDKIVNAKKSTFTGDTPDIKTQFAPFTYGEKYLDYLRKFPDMKMGFDLVKTVDNKKSWVQTDPRKTNESFRNLANRQSILNTRGTKYHVDSDRQVLNVKNIELFLNVGQGLEWDVWNTSSKFGCLYGLTPLGDITTPGIFPPQHLYPSPGGPDWTTIQIDASKLSFFEFAENFWKIHINVKNRQTIDDGHGGGYPTLQMVYLDYLNSNKVCGISNNKYTYEKMLEFVEGISDYWVRLIEQMVPATTIWQGGVKIENSAFHRYKYSYKHEPVCDDLPCLGSFIECVGPNFNEVLVNGFIASEGIKFSGAGWYNKITLNGQEYTGTLGHNYIYYSSTTISDIPSTDAWLDNMVSILSGITGQCFNYYVFDDTTTGAPPITNPRTLVVQGCCEGGVDLWNYNTGPTPGTFMAETCLELDVVRARLTAATANIYAFYDTTSLSASVAFAARQSLDMYSTQIRLTGWSGKTYHIPVGQERWLSWANYPWSGALSGTTAGGPYSALRTTFPSGCVGPPWLQNVTSRHYCDVDNGEFGVLPYQADLTANGNATFSGQDKNVIVVSFADETAPYRSNNALSIFNGYHGGGGGTIRYGGKASYANANEQPTMGIQNDWNVGFDVTPSYPQPRPAYQEDFDNFRGVFNNYNYFRCFLYPIIENNFTAKLHFPLQVYGAMTGDFITGCTWTSRTGDTCTNNFGVAITGYTATSGQTGWPVYTLDCVYDGLTGSTCPLSKRPNNPDGTGYTLYRKYKTKVVTSDWDVGTGLGNFTENPTVMGAGGTVSAITTNYNPYTGSSLSMYNSKTGYYGPGLQNFGFGWRGSLGTEGCTTVQGVIGDDCLPAPNPCWDPQCPGTYYRNNGCMATGAVGANGQGLFLAANPINLFLNSAGVSVFQEDLTEFLKADTELFLGDYDYCEPTCSEPCDPDSQTVWIGGIAYDRGDIVQYNRHCWLSNVSGNTTTPNQLMASSFTGECANEFTAMTQNNAWTQIDISPLKFLGGNDFRPREDCESLKEIPENPETTGTTVVTDPLSFKDGIFNIGGQDCYESAYFNCDDLVNPCSCDAVVSSGDTYDAGIDGNGHVIQASYTVFQPEDIVCCGGGTMQENQAYILSNFSSTSWSAGTCTFATNTCTAQEFNLTICNMGTGGPGIINNMAQQYGCWIPCDNLGQAAVILAGTGISLITNNQDPCNPNSTILRPTSPGFPAPCTCEIDPAMRTTVVDTLDGTYNLVPSTVLNYRIEGSALYNSNVNGANTPISSLPAPPGIATAEYFPCCLGDTFEIIQHLYNTSNNTPTSNYLGQRKWIINIDQQTYWWLYFVTHTAAAGTDPSPDKLYVRIPKDFVTFNPADSTLLDPLEGYAAGTDLADTDIILLMTPTTNTGYFGVINGWGATFMTTEEYWGDPSPGGIVNSGIMNRYDLDRTFPDLPLSNANLKIMYRMEFNSLCNSTPAQTVEFTSNIIGYNSSATINDTPETDPCPTDLHAVIPKMLPTTSSSLDSQVGISNQRKSSLTETSGEGGVITFDYTQYMRRYYPELTPNDYKIVGGNVYAVLNNAIYKSSQQIPYNLTTNAVVAQDRKGVQTYLTYNDGTDYPKAKLRWMMDVVTQYPNNTVQLFFRNKEIQDGFEFSLKGKQIGNVEYYDVYYPHYDKPGSYGASNLPQLNFTLSGASLITGEFSSPSYSRLPVEYKNLQDWVDRSIGNNPFNNSYVNYHSDGKFHNFEIRRNYTTAIGTEGGVTHYTPLNNLNVEIVATTYGNWETFKKTSPPISGLTSQYTGYTNLSPYNNTLGVENLTSDKVFDLNFSYTAFTGTTVIPMNGPRRNDSILMGASTSITAAKVAPESLSENSGPVNVITSANTDYIYYKAKRDGLYRFQYQGAVTVDYYDTGWCQYLENAYKKTTNNTYPVNDLHYENLINSSILYVGGGSDITTTEGYASNPYTNIPPYNMVTPTYGFNRGEGINYFDAQIWIERKFSADTATGVEYVSAATLSKQSIGNNNEQYPDNSNFLTLEVTPADILANTYTSSGTTCSATTSLVFSKTINISLDTKCVKLNKGDEIRLKNLVTWHSTSKSGGTTTLDVKIGSKNEITTSVYKGVKTTETQTRYPWYRVSVDACNLRKIRKNLIWDPQQKAQSHSWFNESKKESLAEYGTLYLTTYFADKELILPPKLKTIKDINNLTYLDIPKNYTGPFDLQIVGERTSNWNKALEEGRFTDGIQPLSTKPFNFNGLKTQWTMPVFMTEEGKIPPFPNYSHTYLVETQFRVKGTSRSFSHVVAYTDDINTSISYYNRSNGFSNLEAPLTGQDFIVQNEQQDKRKMYFSLTDLIIEGEPSVIKTNNYDLYSTMIEKVQDTYECECRTDRGKLIATNSLSCPGNTNCVKKCQEFCKAIRPSQNLIGKLTNQGINTNPNRNNSSTGEGRINY